MTDFPSNLQIKKTIEPYGVAMTEELCGAVRAYISLLLRWNQKIALTTIVDPEKILGLHFGESFFAVPAVPIDHGRLADVGSGAGFPGLPLGMLNPDLEVVLVESNSKKAAFLSEVTRELRLKNAVVLRNRMEDVSAGDGFDYVTARALGHYEDLLSWAKKVLRPGGKVVLWIGQADSDSLRKHTGWAWSPNIAIPKSDQRVLLVGSSI